MASIQDIYTKCDELDALPPLNKQNWLYEIELLKKELSVGATVLQVGCMDGTRIVALLKERPDLIITGLEIEPVFISIAQKKIADAGLKAAIIQGDITAPKNLPQFDYVICLNNTLGYMPAEIKALSEMQRLGKTVIISVYGEKFTDDLAKQYFSTIGLKINKIEGDSFIMDDFAEVRRFDRKHVSLWGGKIIETPIGYFCIITGS